MLRLWLALVPLLLPCSGFAQQPVPATPDASKTEALPATGKATGGLLWDSDAGKSYSIPAVEILGFGFLLNQFNRHYSDSHDYDSNLSTIRRNLRSSWVTDNDPFKTNQLGHPYQGSIYHGFARSAGLNYWESLGYTFAGSLAWEIAGEATPPSRNDQIASGIGGSFLGEALFRMANLVLERASDTPPLWREVLAAGVSPSTAFNRLAFGDRFHSIYSSRDAIYYSRLALGVSHAPQSTAGSSSRSGRTEALADFSIDYGLPGKADYDYRRPFDYFSFQATASTENILENVMTRGLLLGKAYEAGKNYRGIWGLYGSYDYLSPQFFRVSSTALSLGTTGQSWLTNSIALQGTVLAGVGYAAVGTLRGAVDRDYHYGVAPQALVALRLIFGDTASLDVTGREYFVTRVSEADRAGHDNIARADVALTWRIHNKHAIAIRYLWNRRDTSFPDLGDRTQTRGTIGIYYTLLGHDRFGAVDWR